MTEKKFNPYETTYNDYKWPSQLLADIEREKRISEATGTQLDAKNVLKQYTQFLTKTTAGVDVARFEIFETLTPLKPLPLLGLLETGEEGKRGKKKRKNKEKTSGNIDPRKRASQSSLKTSVRGSNSHCSCKSECDIPQPYEPCDPLEPLLPVEPGIPCEASTPCAPEETQTPEEPC